MFLCCPLTTFKIKLRTSIYSVFLSQLFSASNAHSQSWNSRTKKEQLRGSKNSNAECKTSKSEINMQVQENAALIFILLQDLTLKHKL